MKSLNKDKRIWLALLGKDEKEIKKIEKARANRDARFFDDWFDRYNSKREKSSDVLGTKNKRRKDDWL